MTNKEFEAQKQEITEQLNIINQFGFDYNDYAYLHDTISGLQPPKPPTCSSCNRLKTYSEEVDYNLVIDKFKCSRKTKSFELNNPYEQSCIHHSDFGAANG